MITIYFPMSEAIIFNSTAALAYYDLDNHWTSQDIDKMKKMDILK
ncbi:MAG: hypothetical protein Q4P31_04255 [Andreesenia angusta]|nr:hypothetical protein [Andreesenia angusta]